MRAGHYEDAIQGLQAGLARYPDSPTLRAGIVEARSEAVASAAAEAAAARNEGRLDDAEKILRRALQLQPQNDRIESLLAGIDVERRQRAALTEAEALFAKRKLTAASGVIAEALKPNPKNS